MKKCVSCTKDLPDTALHCVFCGAKQPATAPAAPPAAASNKTVMGYSAAELLKGIGGGGAPKPAAPAPAPPPAAPPLPALAPQPMPPVRSESAPMPPVAAPPPMAPMGASPMMAPPPAAPPPAAAFDKTAFVGGPSPFAQAPPPAAPMPPPAAPMPPPAAAAPPASQARTMFMDGGAGPGAMGASPMASPGGMPAGGPMAPNPAAQPNPMVPAISAAAATYNAPAGAFPAPAPAPSAPPPAAGPPPPMAAPAPMGVSPMAPPQRAGSTAQVHAQPPYLASQTAARMGRPIDPFQGSMQIVLILFGIVLIAAFVTPLTLEPKLSFKWDLLSHMPAKIKVAEILLAAAGLLGILLGAIPMPTIGRAAVGAAFGLIGLVYTPLVLAGKIEWQPLVATGAMLTLPGGLLLRGAYRDAVLGRILATIGALCILALYFVPQHGHMPFTNALDALQASHLPGKMKVIVILALVPLVLAIGGLLSWLPGPGSAGAPAFAWLTILYWVLIVYTGVVMNGHIGEQLKHPNGMFFGGMGDFAMVTGLTATAYMAYCGFGLAALLGKNLERR